MFSLRILNRPLPLIISPQDGQHSVCQHAPTQAGPAAQADRGEAEAEAGHAEQEDRAERPEGRRREEPARQQQQEGAARLRRAAAVPLPGEPGLHDNSPGQSRQSNTSKQIKQISILKSFNKVVMKEIFYLENLFSVSSNYN